MYSLAADSSILRQLYITKGGGGDESRSFILIHLGYVDNAHAVNDLYKRV